MTTLIIDREEGIVVSDSRATQEDDVANFKLLPYPHMERETNKTYSTTQKIFEVYNHVIVGCGSLAILELFVHKIKMCNFHFDNTYYHKFGFGYDLDDTSVYISKRVAGKVYILKLAIEPISLGFGWWKLKVTKSAPTARYTLAGSGRQFATGALGSGNKDIKECIKISSKFDPYTDDNIQMVTL